MGDGPSKFGSLSKRSLIDRGQRQSDLAAEMSVSSVYVSSITTGTKRRGFLSSWWLGVDRVTIIMVAALSFCGLVLAMASSSGLAERHGLTDFYFVQRQAVYCIMAFCVMLALSMMPIRRIVQVCLFGSSVFAMALLLLPAFGTDFGKGAVRWYSLGGLSFQPSEFVKPFFVMSTGLLLAKDIQYKRAGLHGTHISALLVLVLVAVLALQSDYGQAALMLAAWLVMYLVSGARLTGMVILGGLVITLFVVAYYNSQHVARRINSFLHQEVDPTEQIGYSIRAIENGGMFGVGVGEGTVKFTLPDAHTDFIIAVAAEEYGFAMVGLIIVLYLVILVRSFSRLALLVAKIYRVAEAGLVSAIGFQALINMGVSVKFFPAKGMTLPFVSYGGSSAIA